MNYNGFVQQLLIVNDEEIERKYYKYHSLQTVNAMERRYYKYCSSQTNILELEKIWNEMAEREKEIKTEEFDFHCNNALKPDNSALEIFKKSDSNIILKHDLPNSGIKPLMDSDICDYFKGFISDR